MAHVPTDDCSPDACFACKMRYWRQHGGLSVSYPYGQDAFHGATISERARKQVEDAKAAGLSPEPCGQRWV